MVHYKEDFHQWRGIALGSFILIPLIPSPLLFIPSTVLVGTEAHGWKYAGGVVRFIAIIFPFQDN